MTDLNNGTPQNSVPQSSQLESTEPLNTQTTDSLGTQATSDTQATSPLDTQTNEPRTAAEESTQPQPVVTPSYGSYGSGEPLHAANYTDPVVPSASKKGNGAKTFLLGFAGAAVACVVALGGFGVYNAMTASNASPTDTNTPVLGAQTSTPVALTNDDIMLPEVVAAKCLPSVVAVDVYVSGGQASYYGTSSDSSALTKYSQGSGVVLTADGYLITNYHVVEGGDAYKVTIESTEYDATLVGSDPTSDIAVLKVDATGLTPIELGDSDDLTVGEWVMTLGSPFGLEQSVATGIVSATNRSQFMSGSSSYGSSLGNTIYPNMIQTDAAINPGNSGGAMVDSDGRLIGINTLITSYSGNYSGVGFAIPVNYAVYLAEQIISGEAPAHAYLGITMSSVTDEIAQRYGLSSTNGAYVTSVAADSAAAQAGIVEGDVITQFDGKAVETTTDLMMDVRSKAPDDEVTLTIVGENGQSREVNVTLGFAQDEITQSQEQRGEGQQGPNDGNSNDYGYGYGYGYEYGNPYGYGYGDQYDFPFGFGFGN